MDFVLRLVVTRETFPSFWCLGEGKCKRLVVKMQYIKEICPDTTNDNMVVYFNSPTLNLAIVVKFKDLLGRCHLQCCHYSP